MLIVSGIIFTTYGIFSLLTSWTSTGSFEWPTILIIIIGVVLLPIGKMIKKQQVKKDKTLEVLKKNMLVEKFLMKNLMKDSTSIVKIFKKLF